MITRCDTCRAVTMDGCDPTPLTQQSERGIRALGVATRQVVPAGDGWQTIERTPALAAHFTPGVHCDALPAHDCHRPALATARTVHAPRGHVTKASLLEVYGTPGGPRNARPAKCRCGQWCLRGLDDDVMAFGQLADPWPIDPAYGRAMAGAAGRIVLNVTRKDGHPRFHHPWNPVPYSERVFVSLPTHECGNGLPSIGMPTIEEVVSVNDPWNEDCECTF